MSASRSIYIYIYYTYILLVCLRAVHQTAGESDMSQVCLHRKQQRLSHLHALARSLLFSARCFLALPFFLDLRGQPSTPTCSISAIWKTRRGDQGELEALRQRVLGSKRDLSVGEESGLDAP